ncbi:MAG TPA: imidazole glycerol phosphate synthase subunit HisH, partial [Pirellulales bacterium]
MIAIIDYQMGNLRSVQKALERVGHPAVITSSAADIAKADKVILPGVGAFEDAIAELRRRDLVGPIKDAIAADKPFLGICLGLQLLFDVSYENGTHEGLGVLPGEVVKFEVPAELKVPHMGWNALNIRRKPPVLEGLAEGTHVYFV